MLFLVKFTVSKQCVPNENFGSLNVNTETPTVNGKTKSVEGILCHNPVK